jgi:Spy/CpxP family protein refolding chaperone
MKLTRAGVLALSMAVTLGAAAGEPPKSAPSDPAADHKLDHKIDKARTRADQDRLREEVIDRFRAERMWKLTEALKLDEATAAKVFPLLSKYDEKERGLGHERGDAMKELREALDAPTPDSKKVDGLVQRLIALRTKRHAIAAEKLQALRKVLSAVQMGKLMLVTPRIDDAFRERIREALDGVRAEDANTPRRR